MNCGGTGSPGDCQCDDCSHEGRRRLQAKRDEPLRAEIARLKSLLGEAIRLLDDAPVYAEWWFTDRIRALKAKVQP